MAIEYFLDVALTESVLEFVNDPIYTEFSPIRQQEVGFLCAFMLKAGEDGEESPTSGDPVVIKKIADADRVFMDGRYRIYVDQFRWKEANEIQQKAMLHRALMRINVISGEDGVKYGTRKPEIVEFQATALRFGAWSETLLALRANLDAAIAKNAAKQRRPVEAKSEQPRVVN